MSGWRPRRSSFAALVCAWGVDGRACSIALFECVREVFKLFRPHARTALPCRVTQRFFEFCGCRPGFLLVSYDASARLTDRSGRARAEARAERLKRD